MSFLINPYVFGAAALPALNLGVLDGCQHVARADDKWINTTHATAPAGGISGMNGLCYDDSVWGQKILTVPETGEFTATWKFRVRGLAGETVCIFANGATVHFQLEMNATGTMDVTCTGGFGTHTTTDTLSIDTTYVIEFYGLIHATAGAYRLKINGVVPNKSGGGTMDQTGLDTQNGATSTITRWRLGATGTSDTYTDDHALDTAGNDIGDGQVETLYANGAGDLAGLTRGGSDSGANWSQCDEATQNEGTDYVVTTVNGSTFKNQLRIGGVNYDGATTHTGIADYNCYVEVWNTNPATSLPWTDSDINSLQAGIFGIDANQRDVYAFQNRSVSGTPRAVQVCTVVSLNTSRLRMTQVVLEVWVTP